MIDNVRALRIFSSICSIIHTILMIILRILQYFIITISENLQQLVFQNFTKLY